MQIFGQFALFFIRQVNERKEPQPHAPAPIAMMIMTMIMMAMIVITIWMIIIHDFKMMISLFGNLLRERTQIGVFCLWIVKAAKWLRYALDFCLGLGKGLGLGSSLGLGQSLGLG